MEPKRSSVRRSAPRLPQAAACTSGVAVTLMQLSGVVESAGNLAECERLLREALDIYYRLEPGSAAGSSSIAQCLWYLGKVVADRRGGEDGEAAGSSGLLLARFFQSPTFARAHLGCRGALASGVGVRLVNLGPAGV